MYVHPTYAVTTAREPLGILDVWMWARELRDATGQRGGPKESLRWIEGYERLAELALGQKVYAALPGAAKQWFVAKGASHNAIFGHKDVMPVYCAFVNRASAPPAPSTTQTPGRD